MWLRAAQEQPTTPLRLRDRVKSSQDFTFTCCPALLRGIYRKATVWSDVISNRLRQRWFLQWMVSSIRTR